MAKEGNGAKKGNGKGKGEGKELGAGSEEWGEVKSVGSGEGKGIGGICILCSTFGIFIPLVALRLARGEKGREDEMR